MNKKDIIWKDRKRTIFGLPWTFTVYKLTGEKILIDTGFFNQREEEVMLFRITDITLSRTLGQRLFGLGTIHCCSADKTTPELANFYMTMMDILNKKRDTVIGVFFCTKKKNLI